MRTILAVGAVALVWLATPTAAQMQMPDHSPQTQNQPSGGMMMCGAPSTTGQAQAPDATGKPMQMSVMCPCCQAMMKKGMMQKMQKMPEQMPGVEAPK